MGIELSGLWYGRLERFFVSEYQNSKLQLFEYEEHRTLVAEEIYYCLISICTKQYKLFYGGARGVMVIVVRNGHGDTSSNPLRDSLHFT